MSEATAAKLKATALERGVSPAELISELIERWEEAQPGIRDAVNRLVLVGEKMGLGVGGPTRFPTDWSRQGGLSDETCREIAENYIVWRRERSANEQAGSHRQDADDVQRHKQLGNRPRVGSR